MRPGQGELYLAARRRVRAWLLEHDAPAAIERASTAVLARAYADRGIEAICAGTLDRICGEQLDKYVRAELDAPAQWRA